MILSVVVDLYAALSVIAVVYLFLLRLDISVSNTFGGLLTGLAFSYAAVGHRMPRISFGAWAQGIVRLSYDSIENFNGVGSMLVIQQLTKRIHSSRTMVIVGFFVITHALQLSLAD